MEGNFLKLKRSMQLYGLENSVPIVAQKAEKSKDYICPECLSLLRVRGGPFRQTHFYHLSRPKQCRQHEKSQEHLQLQLKLLDLIGEKEAEMECSFPHIRRIADVAWHAKKLIFEIQCSSISKEEVQARISDYASIQYQVIWILHDKKFNQKQLNAAEILLRNWPCYFTNMDQVGKGMVYDQFEIVKNHRRVFKGPPLSVFLHSFFPLPKRETFDALLPQAVARRFTNGKYFMQGDLLGRLLKEKYLSHALERMVKIENKYLHTNINKPYPLPIRKWIANCYEALIDYFLKKLSRH